MAKLVEVECLLSSMKPRVLCPALHKLGMTIHDGHPRTREGNAGGSGVQGHLWLRSHFEVTVGWIHETPPQR